MTKQASVHWNKIKHSSEAIKEYLAKPIENTVDISENPWLVKENPQKAQDDKDHQNAETTMQVEVPKAPLNQNQKGSKRRERDSGLEPERLKAVKITIPICYEIIVDYFFNGENEFLSYKTSFQEALQQEEPVYKQFYALLTDFISQYNLYKLHSKFTKKDGDLNKLLEELTKLKSQFFEARISIINLTSKMSELCHSTIIDLGNEFELRRLEKKVKKNSSRELDCRDFGNSWP